MADRRVKGAPRVLEIVDEKNRYLTSILVGNTIVLLASDSLATYVAIELGLPAAALLSTIVMTIVILLFGEIIPKMVATADGERWALRLALPMRVAAYILTPIAQSFQFVTELMLRPFGIKHARQMYVTEEDIRTVVNVGAELRVIEEEERELIH